MSIVDFLCEYNARVSYGDRWMVVDEEIVKGAGVCYLFTVYKKQGRKTVELYKGGSEDNAVAALMGETK